MRINISEATPRQLDYLVAECEKRLTFGLDTSYPYLCALDYEGKPFALDYTTNWALGGPIIEREGITITLFNDYPNWDANMHATDFNANAQGKGPTPLIAAMRCFVTSRLGDEVWIPEELGC